MTTNFDMTDLVPTKNPNHAPDYAALASTKYLNNMKTKAAETEAQPNQIYNNNLDDLPAEALLIFCF